MAEQGIVIQLDADTLARIDSLMAKSERSRTEIIDDMLRRGLDAYEHDVAVIEERLREVEDGEAAFILHAEPDEWIRRAAGRSTVAQHE